MRNNLALLGIPDLPIDAFRHVGDRKIRPQGGVSSVVESVSDTVSNAVSSVSDALATVDDTVNSVVPGGWATVASIAVPVAAPYIQAANVLDKGGSLEDVAKNYAFSQIGGEVGGQVAGETGSALAGKVAGGTTAGLLSGATPEQALTGGALNAVSPTGLLSQATSAQTPTADTTPTTPTTGATNMADISQIYDYGNVPTDITGGQGTFDTGTAPYTQAQIDAMTPQTYTGTGVNPQLDSIIKSMLAAGGTAATTAKNYLSSLLTGTSGANLVQGGLQTAGGLMQTQASKDAALKAQQDLLAATGSATAGSQFRPVGVTTRFGSSQFNIDPATGQLVSAGYTASPEITSAQNQLLNLGSSYLAQTPEQVAQNYLSKQYELLDPSRQRQLASIRNQAFQTGRGGLSVGSTGLRPSGAQGLMGSNPELEAYYNALAQQDAQLAAGAQTAGQQQVLYGAGLFGQAGNLESMAQQPFTLGTGLGTSISGAGANAGRLGLTGASLAAGYGTSPAATTSPGAYIASGLGSPTSTLGAGLANWLTSNAPSTGGITSQGMNAPTVDAYGNYVPLGYANY
jgi:hypothetical protein